MEMPELLAPKLTSLLLGAMILLSPLVSLFTACADASAAEPASAAAEPAIARVEPIAYAAPERGGEGILNPDAEVRGVWIATVQNINLSFSANRKTTKARLFVVFLYFSRLLSLSRRGLTL